MNPRAAVTFRDHRKAQPYLEALEMAGVEPVPVTPDEPQPLEGCHGLLLTGGTDVDPARYGQAPFSTTDSPDSRRDALECVLLGQALTRDLPVLAICRGMQLLNVAHTGTLRQHLEGHSVRTPEDPARPVHDVIVQPDTLLARVLGPGAHAVNSRHHQAVEAVGQGLAIAAVAAGDGVVEALERIDRKFVLAVQWHPEDQVRSNPAQRRLFEAFGEALREFIAAAGGSVR
ncbi:MAG TPA: gamma-glutamyl-gamma-aminobutyrate hydrolase family protein [Bryobacteraceae bacterium]|nr:gamma-glutamyl-gamma-aminobutyrate hydrolase family protein [Bryobacteraceae bacterium]